MPKVLIVDDASFMRTRCAKILTEKGYEAFEAVNGADAVVKYREVKPDIVLMDITMPEMDGLAALKAITGEDPKACIIMCSAVGQQSMVMEAIQAGAKDFVVKPFEPDRLMEAIGKLVGK